MSPETPAAHLVVVAGTGTEVGKTWVSVALAQRLRALGTTVTARKPAQSFEPPDVDAGVTDAQLLAAATGADPDEVCPPHRWYETPMAPPMAASSLGRDPILLDDLVTETQDWWSARRGSSDVGLVELAGGSWSPVASDGDGIDLTRALSPDSIVLVADAGLGTLNAVRPAVATLSAIAPVIVVLNRFDADVELHRRNLDWLRDHESVHALTSVEQLAERLVP